MHEPETQRELDRMIDALEQGELDKIVLTQRNRMRAVVISLERYSELEQRAAYISAGQPQRATFGRASVRCEQWPDRRARQKQLVPEIDGAAMLGALAREDALLVFAAVVDATGTGAPQRSGNGISITGTTVRGVSRRTGLPESAVVIALEQLTEAHLIVASPAGDGWHTDFSSLSQAVQSVSS